MGDKRRKAESERAGGSAGRLRLKSITTSKTVYLSELEIKTIRKYLQGEYLMCLLSVYVLESLVL